MIDRRSFVASIAFGLVAMPLTVAAQRAGKVYRIGYLGLGSRAVSEYVIEAFRGGLRELGWIEGQNTAIDYRFAEGRAELLPGLAAELVRLKVDVIVAAPAQPAVAAKGAAGTIPIVMIGVGDPVGLGLIASLARPGGNITGLTYSVGVEIFGKQLALLKETVPDIRRIAVLWNPTIASQAPAIKEIQVAAQSLAVQIQVLEARGPDEFDGAFSAMAKERTGALLVVTDPVFSLHSARLAELATKSRLPAVYSNRVPVQAGGLMSYGPSFSDMWRRAAGYVNKILKGAKPADLPVEQPTRYELVINLKAAKALGLKIPPPLLLRADEVIQ